jgi:hypothetical protein
MLRIARPFGRIREIHEGSASEKRTGTGGDMDVHTALALLVDRVARDLTRAWDDLNTAEQLLGLAPANVAECPGDLREAVGHLLDLRPE